MTDDRRPRTPWVPWIVAALVVLLALRFALHAVSHVIDLASTVLVIGAVGLVAWRVSVGGRRRRPRQ
jgi:hypothetical protein